VTTTATYTVTTTPFGLALRTFREARRLSQTRLALRAGVEHSYVSRLEGGTRNPSRDAVQTLAAALNLDAAERDELVLAAGYMPDDPDSLLRDEPEVVEVLALLRDAAIPAEYRESIRHVLRMLAGQARMYAAVMPGSPERAERGENGSGAVRTVLTPAQGESARKAAA